MYLVTSVGPRSGWESSVGLGILGEKTIISTWTSSNRYMNLWSSGFQGQ